jgi:hypothetical protein
MSCCIAIRDVMSALIESKLNFRSTGRMWSGVGGQKGGLVTTHSSGVSYGPVGPLAVVEAQLFLET